MMMMIGVKGDVVCAECDFGEKLAQRLFFFFSRTWLKKKFHSCVHAFDAQQFYAELGHKIKQYTRQTLALLVDSDSIFYLTCFVVF